MEWWMWLIAAIIVFIVAVIWSIDWGRAVEHRRAWNLWAAGVIDSEELKRRLDE